MELPENYSPKYRNRLYYANSCNFCFSSENLLKCSSCLAVSYCSKAHQMRDWAFHKPTCIALNKVKTVIPFPKTRNPEEFFRYRQSLMECLAMHRQLADSSQLTRYEREICLLPWVCSVCFRKCSSNFECHICHSVCYCSDEHKKQDEDHANFCWKLRVMRSFVMWSYDEKITSNITSYNYKRIKSSYKQWPSDPFTLFILIQNLNQVQFPCIPVNFMNAKFFMEPYIPAATILNALDYSGLMKNRRFISRSSEKSQWLDKKQRNNVDRQHRPSKKSNLVIHFAISDEYELSFHWVEVARLLCDWLTNVDKVEIVLTGPMLKSCSIPTFESQDKLAGVTVHKMAYNRIENLPPPDIVVMFECQRSLKPNFGHFWDETLIDCLFAHDEVPVILATGDSAIFRLLSDLFTNCLFVEMLLGMTFNNFTDMYPEREWKDHMSGYSKNSFFGVFSKSIEY